MFVAVRQQTAKVSLRQRSSVPATWMVLLVTPSSWRVLDLLSCKHIGSSIENGFTKSIKQTWFLVSGGGGQVASPPFPLLPLWHQCLSFVCHLYVLFLPPSSFSSHFQTPPPSAVLTAHCFSGSAFFFISWVGVVDSQSNGFNRPTCRAA